VLERLSEGDFDLRAEVLTGVQEGRSENLPTPYTSLKGSGRGCPLLRASSDHVSTILLPSLLVTSLGMGLTDLPLRASNEGLLRPRVARAQKIIRLHPVPFFSILLLDLELGVVQPCIHPFVPDQHFVRSIFDDTAVIHDNDSIDAMDSGESMRNDDRRPPLREIL